MVKVEVLYQSSIRITGDAVLWFDPYKVADESVKADYIFITHDHYDHFSAEDIQKIKREDTVIVVPKAIGKKVGRLGFSEGNTVIVRPGNAYTVAGISFETVPAYNRFKPFHPKGSGWVGYIVAIGGERYYIAGDTDAVEENKKIVCDYAFVPIGGTYTMDAKKAAEFVNTIKPKTAIPTHYGCIVGRKEDADVFKANLEGGIGCEILMH